VGEGAVEEVLRARTEHGSFANLDEFCAQVDLRKVGKRALESLVKVGTMDSLAPRHQLLLAIEQLLGASAAVHKAAEVGQATMFDMLSGNNGSANIDMQPDAEEIPARQLRSWEKELVGVYVSEHPLLSHMAEIEQAITAYSGDLTEMEGKVVTLAGTVAHIRPHITKKGGTMAFVSLEDLQGFADLVVFPDVWRQVQDWLQVDALVAVTGRVDTKRGDANVLVSRIESELKLVQPADDTSLLDAKSGAGTTIGEGPPDDIWETLSPEQEVYPMGQVPSTKVVSISLAPEKAEQLDSKSVVVQPDTAPRKPSAKRIVVTLRPLQNLSNYKLRVKWAFNVMSSFPGEDRFAVVVYEDDGRCFELDFANHTTGHCEELMAELATVVNSPDDIEVQPLLL
jgi:DNA polymerase III alpha subunit